MVDTSLAAMALLLVAGCGARLSTAAPDDTPARRQTVRSVFIEMEHQQDGRKYPNYVKESYALGADGTVDYSAYFGGIPMQMNHMDRTQWRSGVHGKKVVDAVQNLLADPAHGPGLLKEADGDSTSALRGTYRIGIDDASGTQTTWFATPGTRAFARIEEPFATLIAAFERETGRPRKPGELPQ